MMGMASAREWDRYGRRSAPMGGRWLLVLLLALWVAGCGGANEEDVAQITGTPSVRQTPTRVSPGALGSATSASRINFQAGSNIDLEMFDEQGRCLLNVTNDIIALAGDYRGRAVPSGTLVAFFIATGRGIIEAQAAIDSSGIAAATFRSLCPSNARDPIIIVAALRGAEPFVDLNSNGRRDSGEPFTDLPREAFLDANRDGSFQPELGEYMIWDPNGNGRFDAGGNGVYDSDTIITDQALILPQQKGATPGVGTPGSSETPATPGTPTSIAGTPTPTATPSVVPAFLQVALFSNQGSDNNDGTITSVITAQVSDADGIALDDVAVSFRILPPVPSGVAVISPVLSGSPLGCTLELRVPSQPGSALSCITYDTTLQGMAVTIEARVGTPSGALVRSQSIVLPDFRAPTANSTPTATQPVPTASGTPTPTSTATVVANAIQFVRAEPPAIGVRQSGLPEQSRITFRVTDAQNRPVPNTRITFQVLAIGGETLSNLEAQTDGDGEANTVLTSGTRASALRVTAGADVNGDGVADVFAQSTQIAVLGAPPAENRFSIAAARSNVVGRRYSGIENRISAFVNDRFGNAVPPGTTVAFISNGASVVDPSPSNSSGIAGATLITDPNVPPSGIVTVLAFTRGEEAFQDVNGDGVFQAGTDILTRDNIPEPFIGFRPRPPFDAGCPIAAPSFLCRSSFFPATPYDLFVDIDGNQAWNTQGRSGQWDNDIVVWDAFPITFSGALSEVSATPSQFELEPGGSQLFTLLVHDDLRNPLVGGSTITVTTSVGTIAGGSITIPDGQSFNQWIDGLTRFHFVLSNPLTSPGGTASVVVTIASENGGGTFVVASGVMQPGMMDPGTMPISTTE